MYKNCCRKCGGTSLHTEVKGNNTGLYCDDCGAWVKWLGKDELRAFEYSMREATKEEKDSVNKYVESISKPTGVNFYDKEYDLINRAIESAKCRIYRLKANPGSTEAHQKKAENQQELMEITIRALEFYRDEYE